MSLGLSRGARKSERLTALMYEGPERHFVVIIISFLVRVCVRARIKGVTMDQGAPACARQSVWVRLETVGVGGWVREGVGPTAAAAFIKWEQLKLHQHKEINQRRAVINNGVIRSLVPQQPIEQMSRHCFIPCSAACICLAGLGERQKKNKKKHPPSVARVNKTCTT